MNRDTMWLLFQALMTLGRCPAVFALILMKSSAHVTPRAMLILLVFDYFEGKWKTWMVYVSSFPESVY